MPTGFTSGLYEGTDDLRAFMLRCTTAFMRYNRPEGDHLPEEGELPQVAKYHRDQLAQALEELAELEARTDEEWRIYYELECEENQRLKAVSKRQQEEVRARYEAAREALEEWEPPTPDHEPYKTFMLDQIEKVIDFDCKNDWHLQPEPSFEDWLQHKFKSMRNYAEYHEKGVLREEEQARKEREWLTALWAALPQKDPKEEA